MAKKSTLLNPENIKTLELYMSGKSEAEVGEALGLTRGGAKDRLSKYRQAGILEGSFNRGGEPVCHWDKIEALKDGGQVPQIKPTARPAPSKRVELTADEVLKVRELLKQNGDKAPSTAKTIARTEKNVRNFRVYDSLWDEVAARAEADKVKRTDVLERALLAYLNVNYE